MRTNIDLDEELLEEAFKLTGVRTKKELVSLALQELIRQRRRKSLTELAGRIQLREDFDPKQMRAMRDDPR